MLHTLMQPSQNRVKSQAPNARARTLARSGKRCQQTGSEVAQQLQCLQAQALGLGWRPGSGYSCKAVAFLRVSTLL